MEELRKAAMARAKQASSKLQAVRRLHRPHLAYRRQGPASSAEHVLRPLKTVKGCNGLGEASALVWLGL